MTWILAIIALAGTILNIKARKECFILWMVTNVYWAWKDFQVNLPAQGWMYITYAGLSIVGFVEWSRTKRKGRFRPDNVIKYGKLGIVSCQRRDVSQEQSCEKCVFKGSCRVNGGNKEQARRARICAT